MMCYIFPRVKCALVFCVIFLRTWNTLWYCWVVFSARGTRSGIIALYFLRVECALALLCYIFPRVERAMPLLCHISRAWNALWYFVLNSFRVVIYLPCDLLVFI